MSKVAASPERTRWLRVALLGGMLVLALTGLAMILRPTPDPDELAKQASREFVDRRFDLAEADLGRVNRLREPTPFDWFLRAQILMTKGKNDEAIEALGHVPDDDSMGAQARVEEGQLELRRSRYRFAEAEHRPLVQIKVTQRI